jgi:hypothetical protein
MIGPLPAAIIVAVQVSDTTMLKKVLKLATKNILFELVVATMATTQFIYLLLQ